MKELNTAISIMTSFSFTNSSDDYQRIIKNLNSIIPFQAACIFKKVDNKLIPIKSIGIAEESLQKYFLIEDEPRLKAIVNSKSYIIFPPNSKLPDPFHGLLVIDQNADIEIHSCLGIPLFWQNELIGVFTADSIEKNKFENLSQDILELVAILLGHIIYVNETFEDLKKKSDVQQSMYQEILKSKNEQENNELIGISEEINSIRQKVDIISKLDYPVLITGETGTGKNIVAKMIHEKSLRKNQPLIYVNCLNLPDFLAEIELFGHSANKSKGFNKSKIGKLEYANNATVFLDEIGELSLDLQLKLLQLINNGKIQQIGTNNFKKIDIRIIATTNRNLEHLIKEGKFRADLYHRLNSFPIYLKPIREHTEDILPLVGYFTDIIRIKIGLATIRFNDDVKNIFFNYKWPGNVREISNTISNLLVNTKNEMGVNSKYPYLITPKHITHEFNLNLVTNKNLESNLYKSKKISQKVHGLKLKDAVDEFQKQIILDTLSNCNGNWSKCAKELGLNRSNLHHLVNRLQIK